jgi:glucosamine--fructose-6-phosphate aminotransferase (isomerizing)
MCGIVGFCGQGTTGKEIFTSLKQLEYRGYDSSGISVLNDSGFETVKAAGYLQNIYERATPLKGHIGIGHTRWATHGPANDINAHPHFNDHLSVVHNGIIENYHELKQVYPHSTWKSETDTEVLVHLLTEYILSDQPILDSLLKLAAIIKGSFAVAVIFKSSPDTIYTIKNGMPLIVGHGTGRHVVASDYLALPDDCVSSAALPDRSVGIVTPDFVRVVDFNGSHLNLKTEAFQKLEAAYELKGYKHFMAKEIAEQPHIAKLIIEQSIDLKTWEIDEKTAGVAGLNLGKIDHIKIVACGSAFHAALIGKYYLESFTPLRVTVEIASEARYSDQSLTSKTLLIAMSQSGETADTLSCVNTALELGCQVLAFCNRKHSDLASKATKTILLECGPEISVASTKAFFAMILRLYIFALSCGRNRGQIKKADFKGKLTDLLGLPDQISTVLALALPIAKVSSILSKEKAVFFLGRRLSYPVALEGALKLKEISYIYSEGYAAGELKHGPLALIEPNTPVISIVPPDRMFSKTMSNIAEAKSRGAYIISITSDGNEVEQVSDLTINLPKCSEELFPFATTVIVQLIAYTTALQLNRPIDKPRNLAKSVTVE